MGDFLAAFGLVFVIEGLIFAAFPAPAKKALISVIERRAPPIAQQAPNTNSTCQQ